MVDFIEITNEVLNVQAISEQVTETSTGATSIFVGTTRDYFQGKKVVKLEYEAYEPMAKKKLQELCNRLRVKWSDLKNIAIFHRLGAVGPREASVIIGKIISFNFSVKLTFLQKKIMLRNDFTNIFRRFLPD